MNQKKTADEELISYCRNKLGAYEARPFGVTPICFKVMGKIFAQINCCEEGTDSHRITLKCTPEQAELYRQMYPGVVVRGYHCPPVQQPYWNTIDLEQFADMPTLLQMVDEAYDAVADKMTRKERSQFAKLTQLEYCYTNGENADFVQLCRRLDAALDELVGGRFERRKYEQYNQRDNIHHVLVIYRNGEPVGCGGFKMYDEEHAELKRLFVKETIRDAGIGKELVRRLEAWAKLEGYRWCILETGEPLQAACHLYQKLGYRVIPNYGPYADMPESICMQRKI